MQEDSSMIANTSTWLTVDCTHCGPGQKRKERKRRVIEEPGHNDLTIPHRKRFSDGARRKA